MRAPLAAALPIVLSLTRAESRAADPWPSIALVPRASGLALPTHVTTAGDGSGRLFVVLQSGLVKIVNGGTVLDGPFLDIVSRVSCCQERGLLSIAFSPRFASTRAFYADYTDVNGDTVIARYRVGSDP